MKWKQLLLVVAVSATSAIGSVWMYNKLSPAETATDESLMTNFLQIMQDSLTTWPALPTLLISPKLQVQPYRR